MSVRLVVTDDHPIMRQALAGYFSRVEEMEVVGQATNGREAVELVDQLLPDVCLLWTSRCLKWTVSQLPE